MVLKVSLVLAFVQQTNIWALDWDLDRAEQEKFDYLPPLFFKAQELFRHVYKTKHKALSEGV